MSVIDYLNRLLGDPNEKELRRLWPRVGEVKAVLEKIRGLQLPDLPKKTEEFRRRVTDGESLDALLPEAFAVGVRGCQLLMGREIEVVRQKMTWDMVPFDVQILGGIVLHQGRIAEMKTGEGKTLVCTLPVYLNALTGKGVHLVTVNDYLARRDAAWMGTLYELLGLSVGVIVHGKDNRQRGDAYACSVTYGTNNEFGFDYLRDNMVPSLAHRVQRGLHYAIVDEVDSILIDEARTPLIISQPADESTTKYVQYATLVRGLQEHTHFTKDEKQRVATLTDEGIRKMEQLLGLENIYTEKGFEEVHHIEQALRAHAIYQRDVDYVVKEGEIIIVDEFTGRLMPGRRYSHGLHQAIEAKEGVEVQRESKTLATITFQNYFRLYAKLAGMTGTAKTEEEEFESIYRLRVIAIPTHRPMIRTDKSDAIYRTVKAKFTAAATIAQERHDRGQPVLIGTTSIEKSEAMSALLTEMKIPHEVLNAKQHEREAEIVAQAGQRGVVTIATNMAGRGTDIKLGSGVAELGGLCILSTERHEARRIDNQLRGRAGRQGDLGESQFFVSMEDDLMRLFGGDWLKARMEKWGIPDDIPLENAMVSRAIENAQKRVEGRNFDIRRHVVQYDDVMNKHRELMYTRRDKILRKIEAFAAPTATGAPEEATLDTIHSDIFAWIAKETEGLVTSFASDIDPENWSLSDLTEQLGSLHPDLKRALPPERLSKENDPEKLHLLLRDTVQRGYEKKCASYDPITVAQAERVITLQSLDTHWMEHIDTMAHLREQVAFAGFAQRDPLVEYKDQAFRLFQQLLRSIESTTIRTLLQVDFRQFTPRVLLAREEELTDLTTNMEEIEGALRETGVSDAVRAGAATGSDLPFPAERSAIGGRRSAPSTARRVKVGRNDPCPCGSGRKYKKCCGKFA